MLILARVACEEESCSLEKSPGSAGGGKEGVRRPQSRAGWEQPQPGSFPSVTRPGGGRGEAWQLPPPSV